jgi:hypothetical protein
MGMTSLAIVRWYLPPSCLLRACRLEGHVAHPDSSLIRRSPAPPLCQTRQPSPNHRRVSQRSRVRMLKILNARMAGHKCNDFTLYGRDIIERGVDSSSQQRPFRSFRLRALLKFHSLRHIIHLLHYILSDQAGFSANRKEKVGWCTILAIGWLRRAFESGNIQFPLGCPCHVNPGIVHMNQNQRFERFWNFAAFSERVD